MTKSWSNFHTHSIYSLLDGFGKVEQYAERAIELGMPALGITDHGNVFGWPDFHEAARAVGLKPALGSELYQARKTRFDDDPEELSGPAMQEFAQRGPHHLTVLARNREGFKNLSKISSRSYLEGYVKKPRMDLELLSDHAGGLVVLSGCLSGQLQQAILMDDFDDAVRKAGAMQDIVGKDNYFIEVMDHTIEEERRVKGDLARVAKAIGARMVATGDTHYVRKEDSDNHDTLLCLSVSEKKATPKDERFSFVEDEFFLKSYDQMLGRHEAEWLDNTNIIADMIEEYDIFTGKNNFPKFTPPDGMTSYEYMEKRAWEGAAGRYGTPLPQAVIDRIEYELLIIKRLEFPDYFLMIGDIFDKAKNLKIRMGPGRGSGPGSCVAYCLGITKVDPIHHGLVFERFLLPQEVEYEPEFPAMTAGGEW